MRAFLVLVLFVALASGACDIGSATFVDTALLNPNGTITMDDRGFSTATAWIVSANGAYQLTVASVDIIISGSGWNIYRGDLSSGGIYWDSNYNWPNSQEKPGYYFWMIGDTVECTFGFSRPIAAFSLRITGRDVIPQAYIQAYDENENLVGCTEITYQPGNYNFYANRGLYSKNGIRKVVIVIPASNTVVYDNFQFLIEPCSDGYSLEQGACQNDNECVDLAPCDPNALCEDTPGSYTCTCNDGFTGDGIECTDINECDVATPCSPFATCNNTEGSFTCTCEAGYEGDGVDTNGCQLIPLAQPMAAPVQAPLEAPLPNEQPIGGPAGEPQSVGVPEAVPVTSPIAKVSLALRLGAISSILIAVPFLLF